jgi:hypothetical protein
MADEATSGVWLPESSTEGDLTPVRKPAREPADTKGAYGPMEARGSDPLQLSAPPDYLLICRKQKNAHIKVFF